MKRKIIETSEVYITVCDVCFSEFKPYQTGGECHMCGKDVCGECSIMFDFEEFDRDMLDPEHFQDDTWHFFCKKCWLDGLKYRKRIQQLRDAHLKEETKLFKAWKKLIVKKRK